MEEKQSRANAAPASLLPSESSSQPSPNSAEGCLSPGERMPGGSCLSSGERMPAEGCLFPGERMPAESCLSPGEGNPYSAGSSLSPGERRPGGSCLSSGEGNPYPGGSCLSSGEGSPYPAEGCLSPGEALGEALPRYHKRAFAHNYRAPFIYHIILKKREGCSRFGIVRGDARIAPGSPGSAYIEESALGRIIAKEILNLQRQFPILKIYQFCVMPDHVHILLRVMNWSELHLDFYIGTLVSNIASHYSKIIGRKLSASDIFQDGYCDKPLLLKRSLDGLYRYIRENPHRLAMRRQYPQFFQRKRNLRIGDCEYEAYGNLFLFRNPDKEAVKISRRFTPEETEAKKGGWLTSAIKGSVLVSPFISRKEKEIRSEAEALGGRIILITHEAFPERYKPAAHDFDLCTEGRLLIISMGFLPDTPISRTICNQMNDLAATITRLTSC